MSENKYLPSRIKSIRVALEGIKHVLITQQNARIHGAIALAVIICLFIEDKQGGVGQLAACHRFGLDGRNI